MDTLFHSFINQLATFPVLTLFVVIGLGYLIGQVKFFGLRLDVAGVLFAGLAMGALSPQLALPEIVPSLGLIIFVYSVGIWAGPQFRQMFAERGARDGLIALGVLLFSASLCLLFGRLFHLTPARISGLFCGSLTNTPALAAVRETIDYAARARGLNESLVALAGSEPVVAYSIAYPLGVFAVIVCLQFCRWFWKIPIPPAEEGARLLTRNFVVTNPAVFGKVVADVLRPHRDRDFLMSRVQHDGETTIATSDTVLSEGDIIVVIGEDRGLALAEQVFGSASATEIELDRSDFDYRRMFVSSEEVVGKQISELNLVRRFSAIVTRVRRGDLDILPQTNMRLAYGDRVRVLTHRQNFEAVSEFFGDSIKGTAHADFGAMALGMVLGVMVGMIPIVIPGGGTLRLGMAGGPLLMALCLGSIQRTGRMTWIMPLSANLTLRHVGLLLFLSGVGTRAGHEFLRTIMGGGLILFALGAIVTVISTLIVVYVGYRRLGIPFDYLMGLIAGLQTQPAVLAYAKSETKGDTADVAYASIYPIATVLKIILAQLLFAISGGAG